MLLNVIMKKVFAVVPVALSGEATFSFLAAVGFERLFRVKLLYCFFLIYSLEGTVFRRGDCRTNDLSSDRTLILSTVVVVIRVFDPNSAVVGRLTRRHHYEDVIL